MTWIVHPLSDIEKWFDSGDDIFCCRAELVCNELNMLKLE